MRWPFGRRAGAGAAPAPPAPPAPLAPPAHPVPPVHPAHVGVPPFIDGTLGRPHSGAGDAAPPAAPASPHVGVPLLVDGALGRPGAAGGGGAAAGGAAGGDAYGAGAVRPAWRALPPLRPTAAVAAPVLIPHRLPRVATTTPMLRTPPPPPRQERPVGLVTGLGIVLSPLEPAVEAPPVQLAQRRHGHAGSVDPQRGEAALRAAAALATPAGSSGVTPEQPPMPEQPPRPEPTPRAARPYPTPAVSLLTAEPRYLGEPRVPGTPYRAPGWLRAAQAMLGLPDDPLGLPPPPPQQPRADTQPAPRPSAGQLARGRPVPTLRTGPPRRPGLGAPLPQPSAQPQPDPPGPAGPQGTDPRGWGISPLEPPERHIVAQKGAERVPPELVTAFRGSHGVDVSDVPVHRGDEAARQAQAIQAGAFTSGGEVFLPAEAGPLTEPTARAMLAHELAHVVQQRTLGSSLPDEHTAHPADA